MSLQSEIQKSLNLVLKSHPKYQDWMYFDDVEIDNGVFIPRYKSPKAAGVEFSESEAKEIYQEVARHIIRVQN